MSHYSRDVNSIEQDSLRVDVWDFNPEESVNDKLKKINDVKDGRGLRKFIKETLHATTGKISHELLGSVEIPLKVQTIVTGVSTRVVLCVLSYAKLCVLSYAKL